MIKENYLFSSLLKDFAEFVPEENSIFIFGHSAEGRSYTTEDLKKQHEGCINFIEIKEESKDEILDIQTNTVFYLRNMDSMLNFFKQYNFEVLYIDSSGLNNRICASLLNNAFKNLSELKIRDIKVLYVEPQTYKIEKFSTEGVYNDLSERIEGIEPLPGFASILPDGDDYSYLVAFLGFEGGRFTYILENVQPSKNTVYPVIGVPGFRAEYPFVAYWGNRRALEDKSTWRNIHFAAANSVVDAFNLLTKLLKASPSNKLKVAPIGTKPHAIGAILFAIKHPLQVELIYDNPIRKSQKTSGIGRIIECSVYKLLIHV